MLCEIESLMSLSPRIFHILESLGATVSIFNGVSRQPSNIYEYINEDPKQALEFNYMYLGFFDSSNYIMGNGQPIQRSEASTV